MTLLWDSALKATLILAMAWIAALLLHRASADLRHRVWLAAILAVAALPVLLWLAPTALPVSALIVIPARLSMTAAASQSASSFGIAAIWAAGTLLVLLRLGAGTVRVARWTRTARRDDGALYSGQARTPMTWGILHPVVLLPSSAMTWAAEEREMVIRHELAHIQRHDWLWQMFGSLVAAVFWFHPLVWLANAQLRREAERAADDRVLASGTVAADYAAQLVDIARRLRAGVPVGAVAMVRRPALENRVREILDSTRQRSRAGTLARAAIASAAIATMVSCAAMQNARVHRVGEPGLTPPRVVSKQEPEYSEEARTAKLQGTVRLNLEIDERGAPQNIRVLETPGDGLDAKAVAAVSKWRFEPARKKGRPVRCAAVIEVKFRLM